MLEYKNRTNINILYVLRYVALLKLPSFQIFGVDINLENTDNRTNKRSHFRTVVISPTAKIHTSNPKEGIRHYILWL